jgi:hypothetical protein
VVPRPSLDQVVHPEENQLESDADGERLVEVAVMAVVSNVGGGACERG